MKTKKYIEEYPLSQEKIMSILEWIDFQDERYKQLSEIYGYQNVFNIWKYKIFTINKDGSIRKFYDPVHLHNKSNIKKQIIGFKNYQIKLKGQRDKLKELALDQEDKLLCFLKSKGYNLSKIRVKIQISFK